MGYDITIYRDISCDITPDHPKAPGKNNFNENRPPCCGLRFALAPCLCPLLALSPTRPFLSSFCCPSDGHIIGLTVPLANINLVPSWFGLLPECMIVLLRFSVFFLSLSLFPSCYIYRTVSVSRYLKQFLGNKIGMYRRCEISAWYYREILIWYRRVVSNPPDFFSCICECFLYRMPVLIYVWK